MTNRFTTGKAGVIALALLIALYVLTGNMSRHAQANAYTGTIIGSASTTASFSVTSSARILATTTVNTNGGRYIRVYATICNPNANPVYLAFNNDALAGIGTTTTIIAAAAGYSACYEITDRNMYQGSVQASSTNQTATTVSVQEFVQ